MKKCMKLIVLTLLIIVGGRLFVSCDQQGDYIVDAEPGFYTLQEAFNLGILKEEDIFNISYYQNKSTLDAGLKPQLKYNENYKPKPLKPSILSDESKKEIINSSEQHKEKLNEIADSGIKIIDYLGTYHGAVVIAVAFDEDVFTLQVMQKEEICGVEFNCGNTFRILVWIK